MRLRSGFEAGEKGLTKTKSEESPSTSGTTVTRPKQTAEKESPSTSRSTRARRKRTVNKESSSTSRSTGARPKQTSKKESPSTSRSTGARPKRTSKKESSSTSGTSERRSKRPSEKDGAIKKEEDISRVDEENGDDAKACVQLSDSIRMFLNKKISNHGEIYEGELRSNNDAHRIVLKLVENIPQGTTEARILAKLNNHPHVLSQIHAGTYNFGLFDRFYIALEKCHRENLREFVTNRKNQGLAFDLSRAIDIAEQMRDGVKYIHENRIIHKDIKPDNILLSLDQRLIKIADFGSSQEIDSTSTELFEKGQFGTDGFRPPESFGKGIISQKSDIFSLGVTFYFVLSDGEHPFGEDRAGWNYHMKNGIINLSGLLVPNIKTTEHLIKSMIEYKINHRPTIWQVSEHSFWTGNEVSCDLNYHCPESAESLIPPTSEEPSHNIAGDVDQHLEHLKNIKLRDEAAAAKIRERAKDGDVDLTTTEECVQLSDSIWLFKERPLAKRGSIFEGMKKSEMFPDQPLAIKLIWHYTKENKREVKNLRKLSPHTHVVSIVHADVYKGIPGVNSLYIAMERCSKLNLEGYIRERRAKNVPFNPKQAFDHAKQVVDGIEHIHGHNILHRDLKPSSVLFSLCGRYLKICDFGKSKELENGRSVTDLSTLKVGTDGYRAPETYNKNDISKMADIFSLAVVLYHLLSYGFHPFGIDREIWNFNIKNGQGLDMSRLRDPFFKIVKELLKKMLNFEPQDRLKIGQVKNSDCMKLDWFPFLIESLVLIWKGAVKDQAGTDMLSCQLYRSPSLQDVVEIDGSVWKFQMNTFPYLDIGLLKRVTDEEPSGYIVTSKDELKKLTDELTRNNLMGWIDILKDGKEPKAIVLLFQPGYPELFGFFLPDPKFLTSLIGNLAGKQRPTPLNLTPGVGGRAAYQSATSEREQTAPGVGGRAAYQSATSEREQMAPGLIPWWIFTGDLQK